MQIDSKLETALNKVVNYLWNDERLDYQGERDHIFRSVAYLEAYLTDPRPGEAAVLQQEILREALNAVPDEHTLKSDSMWRNSNGHKEPSSRR